MTVINTEQIEAFFRIAGIEPDVDVEVRAIGTDEDMVNALIYRIAIGEKTMTYSLPWVAEQNNRPAPTPGRYLIVVDAFNEPTLLLRMTQIEKIAFGSVTEADIAREGIPMRKLAAWAPLHTDVWNFKLAPFGLSISDETPVWAEYFDVVYQRPGEFQPDTKYG